MLVVTRRCFRIVLIVGGVNRALIRQYLRQPNTIVIVFDNRNEIARHRKFFDRHGVFYFELGSNATSYGLLEGADPQVREAGHGTANFNTNLGKGARPFLGYLAAMARLQQPDFLEFLDKLPDLIMEATGGCPELFQVITLFSSGGATGGGAGTTIERTFVVFLSSFGWAVQSNIIILGPITFAGAAPRARQIGAATLVHVLAAYTNPPPSENGIARAIYVAELPPLGKDQARRDRLLHHDLQALSASALQFDHTIEHPNNAATHALGHFYSREIDFIGSLLEGVVASQLAIAFRNEFDRGVQSLTVFPGLIDSILVDHTRETLERPAISAIAANVDEATPERLMLMLEQVGYVNHVPLTVVLFDGRHIEMNKHLHDFRKSSRGFNDTCNDLVFHRTMVAVLAEELAECEARVEHVENLRAQVEEDLRRSLYRTQRSRGRRRVRNMAELLDLMEGYRNVCDELRLRNDIVASIVQVQAEVDEAAGIDEKRLDDAQSVLSACYPSGEKPSGPALILAPALDEAFSKIVPIAMEHQDAWPSMLAEQALGVTVYGLMRIAGAASTKFDQIAKAILDKEPEVASTPLGSKQRLDPAATYLVLPHAPSEVRTEMTQAIERLDKSIKVYFTDGIRFGASAVRFQFRQFLTPRDILEGPILEELNQALRDDAWLLNFINGTRDIEALGAEIVDGKIVFPESKGP